jgi:hypothetical protein
MKSDGDGFRNNQKSIQAEMVIMERIRIASQYLVDHRSIAENWRSI